jgi:hypothetical protein
MAGGGATRIIERLIDDEYVHEQLTAGAQRLGAAYRRARTLRREEAVRDQTLYDHVRVAAGSLTEAARRVAGKPPPRPPKRWPRRLGTMLTLGAVGGLVRTMHRVQQERAAERAVPGPSS